MGGGSRSPFLALILQAFEAAKGVWAANAVKLRPGPPVVKDVDAFPRTEAGAPAVSSRRNAAYPAARKVVRAAFIF